MNVHTHPAMERQLGLDETHVIIDKSAYDRVIGILNTRTFMSSVYKKRDLPLTEGDCLANIKYNRDRRKPISPPPPMKKKIC